MRHQARIPLGISSRNGTPGLSSAQDCAVALPLKLLYLLGTVVEMTQHILLLICVSYFYRPLLESHFWRYLARMPLGVSSRNGTPELSSTQDCEVDPNSSTSLALIVMCASSGLVLFSRPNGSAVRKMPSHLCHPRRGHGC